jgi:hypothetical protein
VDRYSFLVRLFHPQLPAGLIPAHHQLFFITETYSGLTDSVGIRYVVEVRSLYEASALAIAEFRGCGFTANAPGPATRLTVTVKEPSNRAVVKTY